jgi:hypothetical protein
MESTIISAKEIMHKSMESTIISGPQAHFKIAYKPLLQTFYNHTCTLKCAQIYVVQVKRVGPYIVRGAQRSRSNSTQNVHTVGSITTLPIQCQHNYIVLRL